MGGGWGVWGIEKKIQDPLSSEKKITRTGVNTAVCFVKI